MKNSFFNRFVPKEPKFFLLLKDLSATLKDAADALAVTVGHTDPAVREEDYKRVKEIERKGDVISNNILGELETTFITPLDREDIHSLTDTIEEVIDGINRCAKRINIYNPKNLGLAAKDLCAIIQQEAEAIHKGIDELDYFRKSPKTMNLLCEEIHDLENRADDIYEEFVKQLFETEKDAIELIKVKEIMHEFERTTDAAEHVGKVFKSIIVKYA